MSLPDKETADSFCLSNFYNLDLRMIFSISIITQVIIEILALSLAENGVIFRYNHRRRADFSGRTNFDTDRLALCLCV